MTSCGFTDGGEATARQDRKSTRLNSSHLGISYAVFCLKKKTILSGSCGVVVFFVALTDANYIYPYLCDGVVNNECTPSSALDSTPYGDTLLNPSQDWHT